MVEGGLGEGYAFVAAVAQQIALEAQFSQPGQHQRGVDTVVGVGRRQFKIEQGAMLVADGVQFDAFDQLATVTPPPVPAGWCRAQRALARQLSACEQRKGVVYNDRRWQGFVTAGNVPVEGYALFEPATQPQSGLSGERAV
jgi:hypothetical protein